MKNKSLAYLAIIAAVLAGTLYAARWIWELSIHQLANQNNPDTFIEKNFWVVKLLMLFTLFAIYRLQESSKGKTGFWLAGFGLFWMSLTRTIEAYGAPGPWGFFSSPGLLAFCAGIILFGNSLPFPSVFRSKLMYIGVARFLGGLITIALFSLLGRNDQGNWIATICGHTLLIMEGILWILVGLDFFKLTAKQNSPKIKTSQYKIN